MNLYLLRHGIAADVGSAGITKDSERPLTGEGKRKLRSIGQAMDGLELSFDLILSSPYVRAAQTADIIAAVLKTRTEVELTENLCPGGSHSRLVEEIKSHSKAEEVLLVGHEPSMSELISLLVSGETGFAVVMKKGGLCKLSVSSLRAGRCAALEWLLTPKQMAGMS